MKDAAEYVIMYTIIQKMCRNWSILWKNVGKGQFICDDCLQYIQNVILSVIEENVKK